MKREAAIVPPEFRPFSATILSETAVTGAGKIAVLIAQFLGIKALTTRMTMADYGHLSVVLSASMFANLLFYGPFGQGVARFLPIAIGQHAFAGYERVVWKLAGRGMLLLLGVALLAAAADFSLEGSQNLLVILAIAALAVADGVNGSLVAGLLNAHRKRALSALVELLDKGKYGVACLALNHWGGGYRVVLGSFVITALTLVLLSSYLYRTTFSHYRLPVSEVVTLTDFQTSITAYSSPFVVWGVFAWGQQFLERYMLERSHPLADVAAYAVINQFGFQSVSLAGALLMQIASPVLFRRVGPESGSAGSPNRLLWGFVTLMMGVLLLTVVYAQDMLTLFTAEKYRLYAGWLPWMMVAGILFASGQILSLTLLIRLETRRLLKPKLCAALLEIGLLGLLVPAYGISGVVGSSIVANAVYCGGVLLLTRSKTRRHEVVG